MLFQWQIWTVAKIFAEILNQNTDENKAKEDTDIENDFDLSNSLTIHFHTSNTLIHYYLAKNLNIFSFLITISY